MKNLKIIENNPEVCSNLKQFYVYIGVSYYFLGEKDQSAAYVIKALNYIEKPMAKVMKCLIDVSTRNEMLDYLVVNAFNKELPKTPQPLPNNPKNIKDKDLELDLMKIREKNKKCLIF